MICKSFLPNLRSLTKSTLSILLDETLKCRVLSNHYRVKKSLPTRVLSSPFITPKKPELLLPLLMGTLGRSQQRNGTLISSRHNCLLGSLLANSRVVYFLFIGKQICVSGIKYCSPNQHVNSFNQHRVAVSFMTRKGNDSAAFHDDLQGPPGTTNIQSAWRWLFTRYICT